MMLKRVAVVGLGLMGGSLALALRPSIDHLTAVDTNPETRARARQVGLADDITGHLAQGIAGADLVILATPVRTILHLLRQLPVLRPDGCLVMDLGSTKEAIGRGLDELPASFQAIGGHPLCGRETAGLAHATAVLYQGQTFVLCRSSRTTPVVEAVARQIIEWIGARPLFLTAGQHDELLALTSHLPYLVAAVLMGTVAAAGQADAWQVTASGFRDTSRLAGSDPAMMLDILLTNRPAILKALAHYQAELTAVTHLLQTAGAEELATWLRERQAERRGYEGRGRGGEGERGRGGGGKRGSEE
jgi:prephenate dehydrogenase